MSKQKHNPTADDLLFFADELVIVNDGVCRWVGKWREVYAWIKRAGLVRTLLPGGAQEVEMTADEYEAMCRDVACYVDTTGSHGPTDADPYDLIDQIEEQGAAYLYVR